MATFQPNPNVSFNIVLTLSEEEARALNALTVYRTDSLREEFYSNLGRAYLEKHERGLRKLFKSVQDEMILELNKIDRVRSFIGLE